MALTQKRPKKVAIQRKLDPSAEFLHFLVLKPRWKFFGYLLQNFPRLAVSSETCETVAFRSFPEGGSATMRFVYNPEFLSDRKNYRVAAFMVEHTLCHVILRHIQRYFLHRGTQYRTEEDRRIYDWAADLATNSLIINSYQKILGDEAWKEFKELIWLPKDLGLPAGKSLEYYAIQISNDDKLRKFVRETSFQKSAFVSSHKWDYIAEEEEDGKISETPLNQEQVDFIADSQSHDLVALVNKAVSLFGDTKSGDYGDTPAYVQKVIEDIIRTKSIPWNEILLTVASTGRPFKRSITYRRQSRRRAGMGNRVCQFPGVTKAKSSKVILYIDTSGSMSNRDLATARGVVENLLNTCPAVDLWIAQGDTELKAIHPVKSMEDFGGFVGEGGTCFMEPLKQLRAKHTWDLLCIFTDGYGPSCDAPPDHEADYYWFIQDGNQRAQEMYPKKWGKIVYIKEEDA